MGIKIINSFDLNSPLPLDARAVANNINEMNELITKNFVGAGQMCYNKADNKLYVLKKNSEGALLSWHEIADSVDLDNINKVLPTDIAVKDNKLGLEHDNVWLTNQNAITLGSNLEYDVTTKTLNAKGGSGGESDTAIITLTAEQVQSLSQFEITFTQEQATLLEKATSFKFYYAGNEIAHGQCGKIIQGSTTVYGLSMILGNNIFSGLGSGSANLGPILDYKEQIILAAAFPYGAVSNVRADIGDNVLNIDRYDNNNVFLDSTPKSTSIYFDKINGKSIIHKDGTINNYTIPTITFED